MKNILVAVELDQFDEQIIEKATQFAMAFNSRLWLVHIAAPEPDFVGYDVGPQYIRDSRAEELKNEHKALQELGSSLKHKGINAEGLLIQGATIEMIIEESEKLEVDLIITGHHERSFLYKALRGSVSAQIIKLSKIPILIVPFGNP
jgi:nucleotide-binding universal stress UspA family protein